MSLEFVRSARAEPALPGDAEEERQAVQREQEPERSPKWRPSVRSQLRTAFLLQRQKGIRQKLNNQTVAYFMVLFAEVPVEEARNHVVDLAGFGQVGVVPKRVRQSIPHMQFGVDSRPHQCVV